MKFIDLSVLFSILSDLSININTFMLKWGMVE